MATSRLESRESFHTLLAAPGRSPGIPESADVYGWLVGSWNLDVLYYNAVDVSAQKIKAEAHFAWILEGRAIQDVWIMPRCSDRTPNMGIANNMYGTTLRSWDPATQAWRIRWTNPVTGHREDQVGRRLGDDIVQVGARPDGTATRWRFTEITPNSFHWIGEALEPDGKTWKLEGEFLAKRIQ
jgi:hypothetical protein